MGSESYMIGGGKMYFNPTGVLGYRDLGNIYDTNIAKVLTELEHYSPSSGANLLDKTHITKKKVSLKFKADEFSVDNFNAILLGDSAGATDAAYTSGSVTDEVPAVGDIYKNRIFFTAKGNISSVVITNSAGAVTYVLDTDYSIVDAVSGAIKVLTAGAITNGQSLKVDYAYAASTEQKIKVLANLNPIEGKARLVFKTAAGYPFTWVVPKCNLKPDGDIALPSENWAVADFVMDALFDTSVSGQPFGYILQSQTAV